jgi:hypothetical protein
VSAQVQNAGLANISAALVASAQMKYLQWGTGTGATASATAVTTTGTGEARVAGSLSQATKNVSNDTYQVTGTITASAPRTITEVGVFDGAGSGSPPTGGNMDIYGSFTGVSLNASDSIAFTVQVTFQ